MVKSIIYTLTAIAVCIGIFIFTEWYLQEQFNEFSSALDSLYTKIEEKTATAEDGYAVRTVWADKKEKLHVFIPHNDISYIDYWLSECCFCRLSWTMSRQRLLLRQKFCCVTVCFSLSFPP